MSYQPGKRDAYYHRYEYDAENRLTQVISGRDSIMLLLFPEREANYEYYAHGPLARTKLGKLNVQGLDYAYTLQGWLKGVNPTMGGSLTNGADTTEAKPVAQDVFGFSLHYYKSDYKAIWYTPQASSVLGALTTNAAPLYNGNIAAMAVSIPKLSNAKVYNYKYDQLNRLVAMDMYNGLNPVAGTFTASSSTEYRERISYDPNGNIGTYQRNGDAARLTMDNLTYSYTPNTNRLHKVVDAAADASAGVYPNYNDLRTGQADNNYVYDAIGNLVQDVKDTITNISWNVYGNIESITKNAAVIRYTYDASGNRISKSTAADTTFYVRDASGNVLSVYSKPAGGTIAQEEVHLYGSSRLGIATRHLAPDTSFNAAGDFGKILGVKFTRGEKLFELSNHLGNVLVTIADRVVQVKVTSDTVRHYLADVRSANDYYPFGMLMPGRKFNAGGFRYGFNGKENDNEVKGAGNQQDYGLRIYDSRVSRFLSTDPLSASYPWYSPYQFAGNNPVKFIDLDGAEPASNPGDALNTINLNRISLKQSKHWNKVKPQVFLDNLERNIKNSASCSQGENTNFCGYSALVSQNLIANDPVGYVSFMIELYSNGTGNYYNGKENVSFSPSQSVLNAAGSLTNGSGNDDPSVKSLMESPADQMLYLSMADKYTSWFNIDRNYNKGDEGGNWAATSYDKFLRMAKNFLGYSVISKGTTINILPVDFAYDVTEMKKFVDDYSSKGVVYFFINSPEFKRNASSKNVGFGTHYIRVHSISIQGSNTTFNYWDYGGDKSITIPNITASGSVYGMVVLNNPK